MDLKDKTVVVTGGTSGVGRATALALAARGAEVLVIGRDVGKGAEVERELRAASGGRGEFLAADLALVSEARRAVAAVTARWTKLDALVLSAGVIQFEPARTSEGHDRGFVINFAHKLVIADGLRPLLARARGRMVLVAADLPRLVRIDWRNFEGARVFVGLRGTGQLHRASLALVQHLADAWRPDGITVTAIHPGQIDTGIFRSFSSWWTRAIAFAMRPFHTTIDRPVAQLAWLAFSPEADGLTGQFFPSVRSHAHRPIARDRATVDRVVATARAVTAA